MCLDFLKISFSDEFFRHYMYPKIVLVTKLFVTKYDLINWNEIFSSLNTVFSEENIYDETFSSLKVFSFLNKSDF